MIRALLVDDEVNNLDNLTFLLQNDCEGIEVAGRFANTEDTREWLLNNSADVVFLDINMPGENGLEFLRSLTDRPFQVIFVTAYEQYALQAIKASALDYLLKPIQIEELQKAIEKVRLSKKDPLLNRESKMLVDNFLETSQKKSSPTRLALPQLGGVSFIEVDDIVSLQADSNYTIIHKKDMQKLVISKTLKEFEELLDPDQFVRIHKSYIVNLKCMKEYSTTDGGTVKMIDGNQWSISRRQLDLFLQKIKSFSLMFGK